MNPEQRERLPAIDYLKAASIVGVAVIHAGRPFWHPHYGTWDLWLSGFLPQFAVPAFFFASGFLYRRDEPIPWSDVTRRLWRVLIPYTIASGVVVLLGWSQPDKAHRLLAVLAPEVLESPFFGGLATLLVQLATASVLQIYYFIFLIVILVPTVFPLSRLHRTRVLWLLGLFALVPIAVDASRVLGLWEPKPAGMNVFWAVRNPFLGALQMFLCGWLAASYLPELMRFLERRRTLVIGACALSVLLYALAISTRDPWTPHLTLRLLFTCSVITMVFLAGRNAFPGRAVRILSEGSLAIYLYHLPFILAAEPFLEALPAAARTGSLAAICLLGTTALVITSRLVLGAKARSLVGA